MKTSPKRAKTHRIGEKLVTESSGLNKRQFSGFRVRPTAHNCMAKMKKYSLNVNEWKFHSPIEWNSCKLLKKEWVCTLNSKFPLIKSENHSKKSELPLIWGVKRRTTRKRIVLRLTPQTSGNSLFLESFSLYMSGNLLFNVQNHSFLSGLQEFHSFGEWNFHSFTFREYRFLIHVPVI